MFYIVYQIKNKIDGKIYIGVHQTTNIDDDYMGSGKYLQNAIEKHGLENFEKVVLHVFDNPDDMFSKEKELVTEEFVNRSDTYNIRIGGSGGWDYVNQNGFKKTWAQLGAKRFHDNIKHKELLVNQGKMISKICIEGKKGIFSPNYKEKNREVGKRAFKGKSHTEEAKKKIGKANSIHQTGINNSNYGKIWIKNINLKKSLSVRKDQLQSYLQENWSLGRQIKW